MSMRVNKKNASLETMLFSFNATTTFFVSDGLYILLKPLKKTKKDKANNTIGRPEDDPRIPSNLKSMVFKDTPKLTCPWSLSGPQFPLPTCIQQRYCYPKGDPEYSSMKGGALWTAYDENGKEDLEYRLLHVYYSAKRAGNKGRQPSLSTDVTPRKKVKETKTMQELPISPLDPRSFASASFDSHLSFDISNSPVDPSIFSNLFANSSSENDSNDNESIITPDRSVFDTRPTQDRYFDHPRFPPVPHDKNQNQYYPTQQANHRRCGNSSANTTYPVNQYPHYYHSYHSYWAPPAVSANPPPSQSYSMDSQDRFMPWGSPPPPVNQKHGANQHNKSPSYPLQEERKYSSMVSRLEIKSFLYYSSIQSNKSIN